MTIYTTVADSNGDFTVPFSSAYTSGEKITVTAEKDSATKSIELYAPSSVTGGGNIQISGTVDNFPLNIGDLTLIGFTGKIQDNAFRAYSPASGLSNATGLTIKNGVTEIGVSAFFGFNRVTYITLDSSIKTLKSSGFNASSSNNSIETIQALGLEVIDSDGFANQQAKYINLGANLQSIGNTAIWCARCLELKILATIPPAITATSLRNVGTQAGMVIKVPAASVAAYQAAANWSTYASRIVAI